MGYRMEGPKVSVCLPTWNSARFLPETLNCLGRQTFRDWELVAADSFSSDGTWELLQGVRTPERRTLFQRPRGLYQAWNACIEACTGEWVYFATSDDWLADDCLETLVRAANHQPEADLIASRGLVLDEDGRHLDPGDRRARVSFFGRCEERDGWAIRRSELLYGILAGTPVTSVNQLLIRRTLFEKVGRFPENLGSYGDYLWQMRAINAGRLYRIGKVLAGWRRHKDQATTSVTSELLRRRAELCALLANDGCLGQEQELLYSVGLMLGFYGTGSETNTIRSIVAGLKMGRRLRMAGGLGRLFMKPRLSRILVATFAPSE